jgi:predicted  nucleic acid-binding Zn-ribbon protein
MKKRDFLQKIYRFVKIFSFLKVNQMPIQQGGKCHRCGKYRTGPKKGKQYKKHCNPKGTYKRTSKNKSLGRVGKVYRSSKKVQRTHCRPRSDKGVKRGPRVRPTSPLSPSSPASFVNWLTNISPAPSPSPVPTPSPAPEPAVGGPSNWLTTIFSAPSTPTSRVTMDIEDIKTELSKATMDIEVITNELSRTTMDIEEIKTEVSDGTINNNDAIIIVDNATMDVEETKVELSKATKEIEEIKREIVKATKELEQTKREIHHKPTMEKVEIKREISKATMAIEEMKKEVSKATKEIEEIKRQVSRATKEIETVETMIEKPEYSSEYECNQKGYTVLCPKNTKFHDWCYPDIKYCNMPKSQQEIDPYLGKLKPRRVAPTYKAKK